MDDVTEGLRERRKRLTRERIVAEALRLFDEQGYTATTCEQIAAAADVSPATFYRYFPSKEDVVLRDEYDPLLVASLDARPVGEHPIDAVLHTVRTVLGAAGRQEAEMIRERTRLMLRTPPLRARMAEQEIEGVQLLLPSVARLMSRDVKDLEVQVLTAAMFAAMTTGIARWAEEGGDLTDTLVRSLLALRTTVAGTSG